MRSPLKLKQKIWFCEVSEQNAGIDRIKSYGKPIMRKMSVSATSGTSNEVSAGIVPQYDRYITSFDKNNSKLIKEGMVVWIDKEPQLDLEGNLVLNEDKIEPTVMPDYVVAKRFFSQKSILDRFGINILSGVENG